MLILYREACNKIGDLSGEPLLREYIKQLDNFTILSRWLSKVFNYIDRYYLTFNQLDSTCLVCLKTFREVVFTDIREKLLSALMEEITKHREKEDVNWEVLHKTIETFINVGYKKDVKLVKVGENFQWTGEKNLQEYDDLFEATFINKSKEYYTMKSNEWLQSLNCPEFINIALEKLDMEDRIADQHMDPKTRSKLNSTLNIVIIDNHAQNVINKDGTGCKEMLRNKKLEELTKMYNLYSRVDTTLKYILLEMGPYIESRGQVVIQDEELLKDPVKFTEKLLELKKEMDEIVVQCFNNDPKFNQTRDRSFLNFMNKFSETPQYIAEYCDHLFRVGIKGMSESEIEDKLEAVIRLFRCLHNRDVFIKAYTKHQASRLLNKTSLNTDSEQSMISKLKIESGFNTIQKLTRMFTDMDLSKSTMDDFRNKNKGTEFKGVDINVDILTSGIWPEQNIHPCKLPSELSQCTHKFDLFYKDKHSGRHLTWLYNSCSATMVTLFAPKTYTMTVTCYQCVILMLFNKNRVLTVSQVKELSGLPEQELARQLKQLCNPKMKLISKENPKVPKFTPAEKLEINMAFKNNLIKLNFIPKATHKKKDPNQKSDVQNAVEEEIKSERSMVLDATIVRIMKARKKERHNELIAEVIKQVSLFKPQPTMIKQSIERLIEKEYLERDDTDRQVYIYIP
jgi:cullin 3